MPDENQINQCLEQAGHGGLAEISGRDKPVVAFDCDGVLTNMGTAVIGQDNNGQAWDVTPILIMQSFGCIVAVMTCNTPEYVVSMLRERGVDAYPDPDITDQRYKCPPDDHRVMVSQRKLLADLYVDDHGLRWNYGDPINPLLRALFGRGGKKCS